MTGIPGIVLVSLMILAGCGKNRKYEAYSEELIKKAEAGDVNAQSDLARCLFKGEGIIKNEKEGFTWARKAAEHGNAYAQFMLGSRLTEGFGIEKNEKEGLMWLSKSAKQGNAKGQYSLGRCYMMGIGGEKNLQEAFKWFTKSAEQGDMSGQYGLGQLYAYGYGVKKDEKKACEYFLKVAAQTNATSVDLTSDMRATIDAYKLAYVSPSPDKRERAGYFKSTNQKDIKQEEIKSKITQADNYSEGKGVRQNQAKALELYSELSTSSKEAYDKAQKIVKLLQLADANVDAEAMRILGKIYQDGVIVPKDLERSFDHFKKSSELGNIHAQMNLGYCYLNGLGVAKDPRKALFWYSKSAESGNSEALQSLSQFYLNGVGTAIDLEKAFVLVKESAEKGNADAQYNMALFYSKGLVVPQNYAIAKQWCEKAARNNNEDAKKLLSGLEFIDKYDKKQSSTNPQQNP